MASNTTAANFQPFGSFGAQVAIEGDTLYVRVPLNRKAGKPSSTGKMILTASSGGMVPVAGADGFKLNLSAGYSAG